MVKTIVGQWFGVNRYFTANRRAIAFFVYIIKDHPVTDGNKRLAVTFLEFYCSTFKLTPRLPKNITLDQLAVAIERAPENLEDIIRDLEQLLFGKS